MRGYLPTTIWYEPGQDQGKASEEKNLGGLPQKSAIKINTI